MKKTAIFTALLAVVAILTGCKTNESNYRAAYEAAVNHHEENSGVDSTIYARIRNQAHMSDLVVDGDSLPLRTEYIGYTDGGGASRETIKRYNVVVGQFKQVFNAKAMRDRLVEHGYEAVIVNTREPLYYVVAATCADPQEAASVMKRVKGDKSLVLKSPLPFILQPAHLAR